ARELFKSLQARLGKLPEAKGDQARLEDCRRRRLHRSQSYFESVAGDWERIRKSYFDDRVASLAIEKLLPKDLILADIGCGTGSLTFELARFARDRKSTRLNSSHVSISYAVFCLKKKIKKTLSTSRRHQYIERYRSRICQSGLVDRLGPCYRDSCQQQLGSKQSYI